MSPLIWAIVNFVCLLTNTQQIKGKTISVSTALNLNKALATAMPGDIILMSSGTYDGSFETSRNGAKSMPITLKGSSLTILTNTAGGDGIRLLNASYWILQGFTVTNTQRGIILEYSKNNILTNLNVHHTMNSAIRIRFNSTDNIVQNSTISFTGLTDSSNGEGVYNGQSSNLWLPGRPDFSNRNTIMFNYFGPNVASESMDIKEGSDGIVFKYNFINGTGMGNTSYSRSWVSVKGTNCQIMNNRGVYSVYSGFTPRNVYTIFSATSGCKNVFNGNVCTKLGSGGKCVDLSFVNCTNTNINNKVV